MEKDSTSLRVYAKRGECQKWKGNGISPKDDLAQDHRQGTRFRSRREGEMPKAYVMFYMMSE